MYVAALTPTNVDGQDPATLTHTVTRVSSQVVSGLAFTLQAYSTDALGQVYEHTGRITYAPDLTRTVLIESTCVVRERFAHSHSQRLLP